MENKAQEKQNFTNVNVPSVEMGKLTPEKEGQVAITTREAMEYREFKRQQKRAEILSQISKSEGVLSGRDDVVRIAECAVKLRQSAVRMTSSRLEAAGLFFQRRGIAVDCVIGGNGETLTKVKRYEAKQAMRLGAKELTLVLSPYQVAHCRYAELRREIKSIVRLAKRKKGVKCKVWVDKNYPLSSISRLARLCSELGVSYFCVPYYEGCEKLKIDLVGGCKLQVSEVENLAEYKKMAVAGTQRIVTERGYEIYNEWMREVEKINFPQLNRPLNHQSAFDAKEEGLQSQENKEENGAVTDKKEGEGLQQSKAKDKRDEVTEKSKMKGVETDYCCRLEGLN